MSSVTNSDIHNRFLSLLADKNKDTEQTACLIIREMLQIGGLHGDAALMVRAFNAVSQAPYETQESIGYVLLAPADSPCFQRIMTFLKPVTLEDTRGVRKMIELSSRTAPLLCDGKVVYGLAHLTADNECPRFIIHFEKKGLWTLEYNASVLMVVQAGETGATGPDITAVDLLLQMKKIFTDVAEEVLESTSSLVMAAATQERGTNILITADIAAETMRLSNQSTLVSPFRPMPGMMKQLTRIDGTLVMDPSGICYAVGAILDGQASVRGNRARGGRYNSAVMYFESVKHPCLIVIFSQDGSIDLVPR